ncbi:HTTM domain-containing protein [Streptomyces sp. URMC 129]|uniref:HTTM domain-containing protein n=1 Tax=Streptomyces sp. URMC 129 TaxID=3423407 RepID=UPI003F1D4427
MTAPGDTAASPTGTRPEPPAAAGGRPGTEPPGPLTRRLDELTARALGPYQTAMVRIGFSFTWLVVLLRELPYRHELYGPDSAWGMDLAERTMARPNGSVLMWSGSDAWFECVYFLGILAAAAMLLGWRTRTASVIVMLHVVSLVARNPSAGDSGDGVLRLLAIYLVFTRCAQVWSLDARRLAARPEGPARTRGPRAWDLPGVVLWLAAGSGLAVAAAGGYLDSPRWAVPLWGLWAVQALWWAAVRWAGPTLRAVPDAIGNLVHNAALLIIMFQVCLIYAAAGWYKIQGSLWQEGTAVYYTLNVDDWMLWPEIAREITDTWQLVLLLTWGTVFVQVAFPFTLLSRRLKNVMLVVLLGEHIGIGLLMGLPYFSMAMIAMDFVFLPTAFLLYLDRRGRRLPHRLPRLLPRRQPRAKAVR